MSHRTSVDSRLSHSDSHVTVREEVEHTVEGLLPWMVSVLVHLAIVLIAFFVVWSARQAAKDEDVMVTLRPSDQKQESLNDTQHTQAMTPTQMPMNVDTKESAAGAAASPIQVETVRMDFSKLGVKQPAAAMPLGVPDGNGKGGVIFDPGGSHDGEDARTVVFCVDASGSMVDSFAYVIWDLRQALKQLRDDQRFTVIFFQAGNALEVPVPSRGYKKASPANVKAVSDWISAEAGHVVPQGATDPISAVKLAMGYQPQLMYLLSDNITGRGRYQVDSDDLIALIGRLQAGHEAKTRINTIQFLYPDAMGTLKRIADDNGGQARFVDESLLNGDKPRKPIPTNY